MNPIPSFADFTSMAEQANVIPVYREFLADTETPVSAYLKVRNGSYSYLLESADGGKRWGRYSFIGYRPFLTAIARGQEVEILRGAHKETLNDVSNPLEVLRSLSREFKPFVLKEFSPFQGGLVGYVNYDLVRKWEPRPGISPDDPDMPEAIFTACERLIVFDHLTHSIKIVAFAHLNARCDLAAAYEQAVQQLAETIVELERPLSALSPNTPFSLSGLEANTDKEAFEEAVQKAKDHIVKGDVIQVVLSQRFSGDISGDDFTLYRNLRSINPSPYMFYLNFGDVRLIGASPEILVRLTEKKIELRPIAGTRPRGSTAEEDRMLEEDLMADPKERAEHIMLVDLGRNDVGKVAAPGSVSVPRLMEVERYSHVMHIVSHVEGTLRADMDPFDVFMSAFPAGTVSGAPKIRAMEIIRELEPSSRGPYAGAVGYFAFSGNMDFCITIRTITILKDRLSLQVGAGIVADSVPENEFQETLNKAGAMRHAIERANGK